MEHFFGGNDLDNVIKTTVSGIFLFKGCESAVNLALPDKVYCYKKGTEISASCEYRGGLGVILSGTAVSEPIISESTVLTVFSKGDVFGAATVFSPEENISRVYAKTDCRVAYIEKPKLCEIFEKFPQSALNFIEFLSDKICYLNRKISIFTSQSASSKLYNYLASNEAARKSLNCSQLAKILGIGRTSLYRAFCELEEKRLIKREDKRVILL